MRYTTNILLWWKKKTISIYIIRDEYIHITFYNNYFQVYNNTILRLRRLILLISRSARRKLNTGGKIFRISCRQRRPTDSRAQQTHMPYRRKTETRRRLTLEGGCGGSLSRAYTHTDTQELPLCGARSNRSCYPAPSPYVGE